MCEDINVYKMRKLLYNVIFNLYENDYMDDPRMFHLTFIESLKNIIEYHIQNNDLSKEIKNNINKFLSQAREYKDEDREKRINIINDIIVMMNKQQIESLVFYRIELAKRRKDFKYIFKYPDELIKSQIDDINDSICHDLYVLISHTNDTSDEEFINEYLPYLKDSAVYYESLNAIFKENPMVFKDKTFYNRMICVLNLNNEIYKEDKEMIDLNNKLVKKIDRKIKKLT